MPVNFGHICSGLLLVVGVLASVGTSGPQFARNSYAINVYEPNRICSVKYYLHESQTRCAGEPAQILTYHRDQFACTESYDRFTAAYAFGIMSGIMAFIGAIVALLSAFYPRIPSFVSVILCLIVFSFLTISWPISESVRSVAQCDATITYKDFHFHISWGLALLIAAWCLAFFTMVLAIIFGLCPYCTRPVVIVEKQPREPGASGSDSGSGSYDGSSDGSMSSGGVRSISAAGSGSAAMDSASPGAAVITPATANAPDVDSRTG